MGLRERRAAKQYQENTYPGLKERIDAAYGAPLEVEVDWDSLATDGMDHLYEDAWTKVYFETLIQTLQAIAVDDFGKEALNEGLSKVVVKNTNSQSSYRGFTFADGVLTIDHKPTTNIDNLKERVDGTQRLLEDGL